MLIPRPSPRSLTLLALGCALVAAGCKKEPASPPSAPPKTPATKATKPAPPSVPALPRVPAAKPPASPTLALDCAKLPDPKEVYQRICAFKTGGMSEKNRAIAELAEMGAKATPHLRRALRSGDTVIRNFSINALRRMDPADAAPAVPELVAALQATDPLASLMHFNVVSLLKSIGPPAAPALPALLAHHKRSPRDALFVGGALGAIGKGYQEVAELLIELARSPKPVARKTAAKALGNLDPKPLIAKPALTKLLTDSAPKVRIFAAAALYRIGGHSDAALLEKVTAALATADTKQQQAAAWALADIGPAAESAVPRLIALAEGEGSPPLIRSACTRTLGRIGRPVKAILPVLRKLIALPGPIPSRAALASLGDLGPAAAPALPELRGIAAKHKDTAKGKEAAQAIAQISAGK